MLARMQSGDKAVQMEIQQYVVDKELGGRKYRGREGGRGR